MPYKIENTQGQTFANPNNQRGYNQQAAEKAWQITLNFLRQTLGG